MANTTDFYTLPDRTVYEKSASLEKSEVSLYPSVPDRVLDVDHNIIIDYGSGGQDFDRIYLKHTGITSLEVYKYDTPEAAYNATPQPTNPAYIQTFSNPAESVFLYFTSKQTGIKTMLFDATGTDINWKALVPCDRLLSFPDGAFNQINFKPTNPTRGKHRMMSGGVRPFQGLGIQKRKMLFGAEEVQYDWQRFVRESCSSVSRKS